MPIYFDKKRRQYCFEFDRVINGRRVRATKLLPKAWNQAQADAFEREESARLYAIAQGIEHESPLIEVAIKFYLESKTALKSHKTAAGHLAAVIDEYEGKRFVDLPDVCEAIGAHAEWKPATIKQRIALVRAACRFFWKAKRLQILVAGFGWPERYFSPRHILRSAIRRFQTPGQPLPFWLQSLPPANL